jgi:hypothetical protein
MHNGGAFAKAPACSPSAETKPWQIEEFPIAALVFAKVACCEYAFFNRRIVVLVFALVVGFAGFIRFAYLQTLSNFEAGISKRAEVYLKRDLTRLQTSDEELCG